MKKHTLSLCLSALLVQGFLATPFAFGHDLGVQGKVFSITERDMRELVMESAARHDWSREQSQLKSSGEHYLDSFPLRALTPADKTETYYIDPSITLNSDINVPVRGVDGQYAWQTYYKKGMQINPLDKERPVTALLYFDARDSAQAAFAKTASADPAFKVVPIEVSGSNYLETIKYFGRPVFHATDAQISRFSLSKLPALVYPGDGKYSRFLAVTVFAQPYRVDLLQKYWVPLNAGTPQKGANQ